jgi:homocysteine S-methyltransferase
MSKQPILDFLKQGGTLLADGAMATLLHQHGVALNACFEHLNLTAPAMVQSVHAEYLVAGARLIETNTFGANRYKLAEYGLGEQVVEINTAAVEAIRQAIIQANIPADEVYIVGSVGPISLRLRPYGKINPVELRTAFVEQIRALSQAGVDAILFETFSDHNELLIGIDVVKSIRETDGVSLPIIAQMTFAQDDRTLLGYSPARAAHELVKAGADVIGVNCSAGPSQIATILNTMHQAMPNALLSAMPNAGYPQTIGGRAMYPATTDYFGEYAQTFKAIGARIIGGCCGTTPAHIAAMNLALQKPMLVEFPIQVVDNTQEVTIPASDNPTSLARRLAEGKFTITVEVAPPKSYAVEKLVNSARLLREAGADVLDVADTPAARMRMSPWAVSHIIHTQVGMETVLHFPTRGRNVLRIQGDLLAAHALDLRNLFVTMGDPTKIGDYPEAMDNFDIAPSKLIELIKHKMNHGQDLAGSSIGKPTAFHVGCALNMFADDLDHEVKLTVKKLEAGADFALGQAVFEPHKIELFLERFLALTGGQFKLPVLMGIMPLYSLRQAQFLHNEVPGISIPDHLMKRMEDAGEDAPQEGVKIAQELLRAVRPLMAGAYIIPAFGKYELAAEVIADMPIFA